jgi:hypothetical protein
MLNTLKHFGFNESFINWVKTLYTVRSAIWVQFGGLTKYYRVQNMILGTNMT